MGTSILNLIYFTMKLYVKEYGQLKYHNLSRGHNLFYVPLIYSQYMELLQVYMLYAELFDNQLWFC